MIRVFKEINNKFITYTDQRDIFEKIQDNTWVHLDAPSEDDIRNISSITGIDYSVLISLLDDEESAHIDVDDDYTLIVLDIPVREGDKYVTYPFSIIYNDKHFLTIAKRENSILDGLFHKFKKVEPHKHVRLSLQLIYRIASSYIAALKVIDIKRHNLESSIRVSLNNDMLLDVMDLNKSLVYFSTSLNANKSVINRVKRLPEFKKYEQDFDLLEDVEVENNQAIEMCGIYREITTGIMDTFSSIISNNLNRVMQALAVITLIISIPTLVASLFGMNVIVPFAKAELGFYIVIGISIVLALCAGAVLALYIKKSQMTKRNK